MLNAYLDPNYDPNSTYHQIEGLLLLFDKVFVYAPNATAMQGVSQSPDRFLELANRRFVIPVATKRYWESDWRKDRAATLQKSDPKSSAFFQWTDFDEKVAKIGQRVENFYRVGEWAEKLSTNNPKRFREILEHVSKLRKLKALPEEFSRKEYRKQSDQQICAKLLYNIGNDIGITSSFKGVVSIIFPQKQEKLSKFWGELSSNSPYTTKKVLARANQDINYELSNDDFKIALEFANSITGNYDLMDIFEEYKNSKFHQQFRNFVMNTIPELPKNGYYGRNLAKGLLASYKQYANRLKRDGQFAGGVVGVAVGALINHPTAVKEVLEKAFGRRTTLKVGTSIVFSSLFGGYFLQNIAAQGIAAVTEADDSWIALIAMKAKERER